jgi:hypothetical protein
MMAGYAALPLWSLSFFDPLAALHAGNWLPLVAFWLLPPVVCLLIWRRSLLLLPFYVLSSASLLSQSLLFAVMSLLGFLLLSREMIFPLLRRGQRGWRRAARVYANSPAKLAGVAVMMENCSLTGLMVVGPAAALTELLRNKPRGMVMALRLRVGREARELSARLVWHETVGDAKRVGLEVDDRELMSAFIASLGAQPAANAPGARIERLMARRGLAASAVVLWGLAMSGAMAVPACGAMAERGEPKAVAVPVATTAAVSTTERVPLVMGVDWDEDGRSDELGLFLDGGSGGTVNYRIDGCKSGDVTQGSFALDGPATPSVFKNDAGCVFKIASLSLPTASGASQDFKPLHPDAVDTSTGAVNTYVAADGSALLVTNVTQLPAVISGPPGVELRLVFARKDTATTLKVPLPANGCTLTLTPTGKRLKVAATIHPYDLLYAKSFTLTVHPCPTCSPITQVVAVKYASTTTISAPKGTKFTSGVTSVDGAVAITDPAVVAKAQAEHKSFGCTAVMP